MSEGEALKIAVDLLHVPSRVPRVRMSPLPPGVPLLLRIAADDEEALRMAALIVDRTPETLREAATFFIEQALLIPDADSYRILGATPASSASELRRNMALLIKWLHPDSDPNGRRSVFLNRVTRAWDDLKTPERRATYDQERSVREPKQPASSFVRRGLGRTSRGSMRFSKAGRSERGLWLRALSFLFGEKR